LGARAVLDKLNEVGTTLTGNAQIAVGDASQHFSDLINQVEELARNDFSTPVSDLGSNVRIAVDRLQEVTASLDSLVSKQRECIFPRNPAGKEADRRDDSAHVRPERIRAQRRARGEH
jgi:hypothetical protein